ncbi:MAG: hypothetical protein AABY26_00490 [Nanoarchaeota archaeon]
MATPKYNIVRYERTGSALTEEQLIETLSKIPISIQVKSGHDLSLTARVFESESSDEPILNVEYGAQLIVVKPQPGKRLADADFFGDRSIFVPSRIMDECTGGGACCSYSFNTERLGLPYAKDLMLDIHKLG